MGKRDDRGLRNVRCSTPPELELLFEGSVELADPIDIGSLATGRRLIMPLEPGGRIEGPRMHGQLLPGSLLIELIRTDGCVDTEGLLLLEMDDGPVIFARTQGLLSLSADVVQQLAEGYPYDPQSAQIRTFVHFEAASDGPYAWLNRSLYVSKPVRSVHGATWSVWRVL